MEHFKTSQTEEHPFSLLIGEDAVHTDIDSVVVPKMLCPVAEEDRQDAKIDAALNREVWWTDVVDTVHSRGGEQYVKDWQADVLVPQDGRVAGDLLPYRMITDDYVVSGLLFCLAVAVLLMARSQQFLLLGIKEFFSARKRENMFDDSSDARMQGKYFFSFVLSVALGALTFNYQQIFYPDEIRVVSPYWALGLDIVLLTLGYWVHTFLYAFVNTVFFDRESNKKWLDAYYLLTIGAAILFMLIALLVVFFELDFSNWQILFVFSLTVVEIFLIFKTYRIFFEGFLGLLHLILYLCSLEFLPLLTLWKGMAWVTQELIRFV